VTLCCGTYSTGDWYVSVCLCVCAFQITAPPAVFLRFSQSLAHIIYVPGCKKLLEQIFEILILKYFATFFSILHLYLVSGTAAAAAKLSKSTGLTSWSVTVVTQHFTRHIFQVWTLCKYCLCPRRE